MNVTLEEKEWEALKLIASFSGHSGAWSWINDPKTAEHFTALRGLIRRYTEPSTKERKVTHAATD
jgi:Flp pilus assembly CpaF family ATPase